jgi:hypothetical protein
MPRDHPLQAAMCSEVAREKRVAPNYLVPVMRQIVATVLPGRWPQLKALFAHTGRSSVAPVNCGGPCGGVGSPLSAVSGGSSTSTLSCCVGG